MQRKRKVHSPLKCFAKPHPWFSKLSAGCYCNRFSLHGTLSPRGFAYVLRKLVGCHVKSDIPAFSPSTPACCLSYTPRPGCWYLGPACRCCSELCIPRLGILSSPRQFSGRTVASCTIVDVSPPLCCGESLKSWRC